MKRDPKELSLYRKLLLVAAGVYLGWWFAIHWILPLAYNPFLSRVMVSAIIFGFFLASFKIAWVRTHIRYLLIVSVWLITLHFYYLFYENGGDTNWIIGTYITIIAINMCFLSTASLLAYSIFVVVLSVAVTLVLPGLGSNSVFLPGLITILAQANIGLRSRLNVIQTLEQSNQRFQLLFHSTFDGIIVHEGGRIINVNESMTQISGYSREELIGRSVLEVLVPSERAAVAAKLSQDEVPPYETKGLRKDGKITDVEVRAKVFHYDDRPARLVTVQDISDRKKADLERIKALALVENLRVRDEFISIASHELKTPISSLKLQTQMIEQELNEGGGEAGAPEKVKEVISLFTRQINRLTELVEAMLDIPRISSGKVVLELEDVDLAALARNTVSLLGAQNAHAGAPPVEIKAPENIVVRGDRRRLEQVIENLLGNAIKYGMGKAILVRIIIEDLHFALSVEDHGMGIAPENLSRIFDRFERAISAQNISGLGLGLYIAKQIVEAHGGTLSVESKSGQGSTFTARFPR